MAYSNGRFPASALSPIPGSSPAGKPQLRNDAARAYNAMVRKAASQGVSLTIHEGSIRRAYRPYSAQVAARQMWCNQGRCGNAAVPGTSNHGWGLALDLMSTTQRGWIDRNGAYYGWAKRWSDASHEWWHLKWRAGVWNPPPANPYAHMTDQEERIIREWKRLKAANQNRTRRGELFRWMINQRKAIYREAQKTGWARYNRKRRYATLLAITR